MRGDTAKRGDAPAQGAGRTDGPKSESLAQTAYRRLEEMIVTLELEPNGLLREAELCDRLGIGRTPVREAIKRLERDGLLEIQPRRGVWITPIDARSELLALEARRVLERLVAGRAARRRRHDEARRFEEIAQRLKTAATDNDGVLFLRADKDFNDAVLAAARNPYAAEALSALQIRSRRFWYSQVTTGLDLVRAAHLHAAVAEAIAAGDEPAAETAAEALLDYVEEFTRTAFSADL